MRNNSTNTPKWTEAERSISPQDYSVPFHARVTKLLEATNISSEDIIGYIDSIKLFLDDITQIDVITNTFRETREEMHNESLYLAETFREVESRSGFQTKELRFIWMQINHLIQPFRNIKTSFEMHQLGIKKDDDFEEDLHYYIDRINEYKKSIIEKLDVYRGLLEGNSNKIDSGIIIQKFQEAFGETDVEISVSNQGERFCIHPISFQILLDNLFSNYQKYGKDGKISIIISDEGIMNIGFENDYKSEEETQGVLSSKVGNPLLVSMIEELFSGEMKVDRGSEKYKLEIKDMQLSFKRSLKT